MSATVTVPFDEDVLVMTNMSEKEFIDKAKFTMAAALWMEGKVTAGQAAKMCGLGKAAFLHELPERGYPMTNIGSGDLEDEFAFARRRADR